MGEHCQKQICQSLPLLPIAQLAPTMPKTTTPHVILFPFAGQRHFTAFLSLADLLHRRHPSVAITLVSTPRNIVALCFSLPPSSSFLSFHSIPFTPADHGLPADAESTDALAVRDFITLFEASESLHPAFDDFVGSIVNRTKSVCIIADVFFAWTVDVARKQEAAHTFFASCCAFGSAVFHSLWSHLPHSLTSSDEFCLPEYPEVVIHRSQLSKHLAEANGTDRWSIFLRRQILLGYKTDAILINTVEEFEAAGLGMLRGTLEVPIWPIGPLLRLPCSTSSKRDSAITKWLDLHAPSSVLYISFGSQNTIQAKQMMELAMALESSGRPFFWVIRPPVGFDIKGEFREEWLPEGFEERVKHTKKGLLIHGWAPQVRILEHKSTGAFLSYCGWNSVLESLMHGKPIIGWPLSAEQFYNVKMLDDELGVCVEVARGNMESSPVQNTKLVEIVEMVMGETAKGREMRRRVKEIGELIKGAWKEGGSSIKALEEFFVFALGTEPEEC